MLFSTEVNKIMKFKLATINSLKPVRGPWLVQGVVVFEGLAKKKKKHCSFLIPPPLVSLSLSKLNQRF